MEMISLQNQCLDVWKGKTYVIWNLATESVGADGEVCKCCFVVKRSWNSP